MAKKETKRYSADFGKKEKVLNYACQTYQLSRPNKVGAVMGLIRECQPRTFEEWEKWYFENAVTNGKVNEKITEESLRELGQRLHCKITKIVIPEWQEAFDQLTEEDCISYIHNLTINRTYDGYVREKFVVNHGLAKIFPNIPFEESPPELDHACDIDYIGYIDKSEDRPKGFGIQIKPMTAKSNFGNYSPSERMKRGFEAFTEDFLGKVFIVFSNDGEIGNKEVIEEIAQEIKRLESI